MLTNGKQRIEIPREQVGVYRCPVCKDQVFRVISGFQFAYDKLNPKGGMQPIPVTLYQCLGCEGFLKSHTDGTYSVVTRQTPPVEGDEWKKVD